MSSRWIILGIVWAVIAVGPASAGRLSPPNIPVEITIDMPSIDPELADLIQIGIGAAIRSGNIPGAESIPIPDRGGERTFQGDVIMMPLGLPGLRQWDIYNPVDDFVTRLGLQGLDTSYLNRFRAYFSSASGGFGVRIGYDRRIRSDLRLTAGTEMLTYGLRRAADILGAQLPQNVSRITLVSMPFGLQQQFGAGNRIIPHVGAAAGPVIRFDHHPGLAPGFYPSNLDIRTGRNAASVGVTVNPFQDFPTMSLTFGGFVETGADVRFGEDRDLSLTLAGRYGMTRFHDSLGNPGDFSGMSFSVGFGKYF